MHTPAGKRVHVQAAAAQLKGLTTGMHVEVAGSWRKAPAAAAAAAAAPSSFAASRISASGGAFAAPKLTTVAGASPVAAAAAAPAVVLSSNDVVAATMSTIFIPSEPWGGRGAVRQGLAAAAALSG